MTECERISKCIFFQEMMDNMPVMSDILKRKYCRNEPQKCARYRVFVKLGSGSVPSDLFPNHHARADALIAEAPE